jgi:hypothetical protein
MPAFPGVGWSEADEPIVALQPGLEEEGEEEQPYGDGDSGEAPRMAPAEEDAVKVSRAGGGGAPPPTAGGRRVGRSTASSNQLPFVC